MHTGVYCSACRLQQGHTMLVFGGDTARVEAIICEPLGLMFPVMTKEDAHKCYKAA